MKLKFCSILFFIIALSGLSFGQNTEIDNEKTYDVKLCDLLKNPNKHKDKLIRIKATYRFGFEEAELYCSDCINQKNAFTDVEFDRSYYDKTSYELRKILEPDNENILDGKTFNVIFVGRILTDGRYGHMGRYKNQFLVDYMESAELIYDSDLLPKTFPEQIKAKTYCQSKN